MNHKVLVLLLGGLLSALSVCAQTITYDPSINYTNNTNLTGIRIPSSVTELQAGVFKGCTSLKTFVNESSAFKVVTYLNANGTSFDFLTTADGSEIVVAPANVTGTITFGQEVKKIWDYAFYNVETPFVIHHYNASINKSTQGDYYSFSNDYVAPTPSGFSAEEIKRGDVVVGYVLSGPITYSDLRSKYLSKTYSYLDLSNIKITDGSVSKCILVTPKNNAFFYCGKLSASGTDGIIGNSNTGIYIKTTSKNFVYTNEEGVDTCNKVVLDAVSATGLTVYIPKSFRSGNIQFLRTWPTTVGSFASMMVPFTPDETPANMTVYNLYGFTAPKSLVWDTNSKITANTPCLIKVKGEIDMSSFAGTIVETTKEKYTTDSFGYTYLAGTYARKYYYDSAFFDTDDNDDDNATNGRDYTFNTKGQLVQFSSTAKFIGNFRAYIHVPYTYSHSTESSSKAFPVVFDE